MNTLVGGTKQQLGLDDFLEEKGVDTALEPISKYYYWTSRNKHGLKEVKEAYRRLAREFLSDKDL